MTQAYLFSLLFFNIVLEVLARALRQQKEMRERDRERDRDRDRQRERRERKGRNKIMYGFR